MIHNRLYTISAGILFLLIISEAGALYGFPSIQSEKLSNGIQVNYMQMPALPLVHFYITIKPGSIADPQDLPGLANITIRTLKKGTKSRTAQEIAESFDFRGTTFIAGMNADYGYIQSECMADAFDETVRNLSDILANPVFPESEVEREIQFIKARLLRQQENPSGLANDMVQEILFNHTPYGSPEQGTPDSLERIKRDDVAAFYKTYYMPSNISINIVGDFDPDKQLDTLKKAFGDIPKSGSKSFRIKPQFDIPSGRFFIVDIPGSTQAQIRCAAPGITRKHRNLYPLKLATGILGGAFTSRLSQELREKRGLTYDARCYAIHNEETGGIIISTHTQNAQVEEAIQTIRDVVSDFVENGADETEIQATKNYYSGLFPIIHQTHESLAQTMATITFFGLNKDYMDKYSEHIQDVSENKLRSVIRNYFPVDNYVWLLTGDAQTLEPIVKKWGKVTIMQPSTRGDLLE